MSLTYVTIKAERLYTWPNKNQKSKDNLEKQLDCLAENYSHTVSKEVQKVIQDKLCVLFKRALDFSRGTL